MDQIGRDHPESAQARLALFNFAFEHAPFGIVLADPEGRIVRCNSAYATILGRSLTEMPGRFFREFLHPDDLDIDLDLRNDVREGRRDGYVVEKRHVHSTGEILDIRIHVAAMRGASGRVVQFIAQVEDITQYRKNERELAERAAQLELAMDALQGGFWHMDVPTGKFETSDKLARFIGGEAAARLDLENYLTKVNSEDGAAADLSPLVEGVCDQSVAEYRLDTISGERWVRCDRRLLRDADGRPLKIVGVAIDFTEEHKRLEDLERNSLTDSLTGLLNRRGLTKRFDAMAPSDGYTLLAIDLDNFKEVNDRWGHLAGDAVLTETARRLSLSVRQNDLVSRTGGDEFVIIAPGEASAGKTIGQRVVELMREPFLIGAAEAFVRATVGGTWTPVKADVETLVKEADAMLYHAKSAGKDGFRFSLS